MQSNTQSHSSEYNLVKYTNLRQHGIDFFSDSVAVKPAEDAEATPLEPESEHHYISGFFPN